MEQKEEDHSDSPKAKRPKLQPLEDDISSHYHDTVWTSQQEHSKTNQVASDLSSAWTYSTSTCRRYTKPKLGLNVHYYPGFFAKALSDSVFQQLERELGVYFKCSKNEVKLMGRVYKTPRKHTAFGDRGSAYTFSGTTLPANEWTPLILKLKDCVEKAVGEDFNFVLVNRYNNGLDHIGEHRDAEESLCPSTSIASLSFGQERDFIFKHRFSRGKDATRSDVATVKISLGHGSLLLMKPPTNTEWYHSLPVRKNAALVRINLTFRKLK